MTIRASRFRRRIAQFVLAAALAVAAQRSDAINLPPGFQESVVFSGLNNPTAVRFASDGRVFVAEKSGIIKVFDSLTDTTPDVFADLRTNVHNFWDRGLLGLALHPDFPATPWVYVLYAYDHILGDPDPAPQWGTPGGTADACPTPPGATAAAGGCLVSGRLSRLEASGNVMIGAEVVMIEDWCQQYPSHSIGSIAFGGDGYLYVTGGDGASFNFADYGQGGGNHPDVPRNPCGDPPTGLGGTQTSPTGEGGALRSQDLRTPADAVTLDGALLRVDPMTGEGAPGNPLAGDADANARRIIGYGLRNPFRMNARPSTTEIWLGDVGWNVWEEVNRVQNPGGLGSPINMGWPCYEGGISGGVPTNLVQGGYSALNVCTALYGAGASAAQPPYAAYAHSQHFYNQHLFVISPDPGGDNNCTTGSSAISGVAFYTGGNYPASYQGAVFTSDYNRRCITVMFPGGGGDPDTANRWKFATKAGGSGPVELQIGPGGDLFYVDLGGAVRRIRYLSPDANASATPLSGPAPLEVDFDGSASTAGGNPLVAWDWDLDGDGEYDDATGTTPTFTYDDPGSYTARLRVTDSAGGIDVSDPITIIVSNTAPVVTIDSPAACPAPAPCWSVGDTIAFSGSATDPQDGDLPASALTWTIVQWHCPSDCHDHTVEQFVGVASGSFVAPDHEYPSYLELRLTATDSLSLSGSASVDLHPETVALTFETSPAGLDLTFFSGTATAPFARTVIVGSSNSIVAPSPQTLSGSPYAFNSWSDGGAASHQITAPPAPATYTATFVSADLSLSLTDSPDPICGGGTISYTVLVNNAGPTSAPDVSVSVTLPAGTSASSALGTGWSCSGTDVVTCTAASVAAGDAPPITIEVTAPAEGGDALASSSVTSFAPDGTIANNTASATTTVHPIPAATAASNDGPICAGADLHLTAATVPGATYSWTGPNGFSSSEQNPTIPAATAAASGTYSVTVTVNGCVSPPATTSATVHPIPAAPVASSNGPVCAGSMLQLSASTVPGGAYAWTGPNGFTSSEQNPAIPDVPLGAAGTYSVSVTVNGCLSPGATTDVAVNPPPAAPIAGNDGPVCQGGTIHLTASDVPGGVFSWTGPNGFASSNQNPTIPNASPASAGIYSVRVLLAGCLSPAATTTASVDAAPPASIAAPGAVCPATAGHVASVADGGPGATYWWTVENGVITGGAGTSAITFASLTGGPVGLTVVVRNGLGCEAVGIRSVALQACPGPAIAAIEESSGPASGGTAFEISGTGFAPGAVVSIGGESAAAAVDGATQISGTAPPLSPGLLHDVVVVNPNTLTSTLALGYLADFLDVPGPHLFHDFVERLIRRGVTAGCGGGSYCPDFAVSRAEMAVFLLRSKFGPGYVPPPATGTLFDDVPQGAFAAAWIERLAALDVTAGCGDGNFCPNDPVTREQMAVFLLSMREGAAYTPPVCTTSPFADVPCASGFAAWIQELALRGITAGCGGGNYCPGDAASRGQMAVFLAETFDIP